MAPGNYSLDEVEVIAVYRNGLKLVDAPDLETRMLCALAARLPVALLERKHLIERVLTLEGSLGAVAAAKLMRLQ